MPEKEGYPKGRIQSKVLVQQPMPKKKTNAARKGKRGK